MWDLQKMIQVNLFTKQKTGLKSKLTVTKGKIIVEE